MKIEAHAIAVQCLPASVRELVETVGLAAALRIVEARGGVRLCVPRQAKPDHWLARLIGVEALKTLVAMYGGEAIEIPRCAGAMLAAWERQVVEQHARGASNAELARRYGYTERGLRKLRRRVAAQPDAPQLDLFGPCPASVS